MNLPGGQPLARLYNPDNIWVVSGNEQHASLDRKMLTHLNYSQSTFISSGNEALRRMNAQQPDIIIASSQLEDMPGTLFLRELRKQFPDKLVPTMMVTMRNRKEDVLEAIGAGCAGYVLRPYSAETLERHITLAMETSLFDEIEAEQLANAQNLVEEGQYDLAIEEFEELMPPEDESERYFRMGTEALMQGKFGKAIIAFNKALALNLLYAEAYKGLADAYKGKGDMTSYENNLKKAAETFALQERHEEVKSLFAEILNLDPDAVNPYNKLGMQLRKKGDYESALGAYFQAQELSPDDENLCYNIAKAYIYLEQPESAQKYLKEALQINPDFTHARQLYEKLG